MNPNLSPDAMSCRQLQEVAHNYTEEQLREWAGFRVRFLLITRPTSCLPELQEIACWVRDSHSHWMQQDQFWSEFVRINSKTGLATDRATQ